MAATRFNRTCTAVTWYGVLCFILVQTTVAASYANLSPVILVPGDGGSQLEARLDKPSRPHFYCYKKSDWFTLWLNVYQLAPYTINCFVDNIRLVYNASSHTTANPPGVEIRVPGFGDTQSVEWLDKSQLSVTSYFNPIVNTLVDMGLRRNVSIRGAPYDFRKAPNEMGVYMSKLKSLIEETYSRNGRRRVVLVAHSMGGPCALYFLNTQTQAWKNMYIKSLVSLAAPWAGVVKALQVIASGDNLGLFLINPLTVRTEQRTAPSITWLMPSPAFWSSREILVYGPLRNYTVRDYKQFFDDINFPIGYHMRQDTHKINFDLDNPGVDVHCLHGVGVNTPAQLRYKSGRHFPDYPPDIVDGPGDGTVNLRSLHGCLRWKKLGQNNRLVHKEYDNVDHLNILKDEEVINYIKTVVQN